MPGDELCNTETMKQNTSVVLKSYAKKFRFTGPTADGSNSIYLGLERGLIAQRSTRGGFVPIYSNAKDSLTETHKRLREGFLEVTSDSNKGATWL